MTIGIVTCRLPLAARVGDAPVVTMMSTLRRTSSAASAEEAIDFTLTDFHSITMFFPVDVSEVVQTPTEGFGAVRDSGNGGPN